MYKFFAEWSCLICFALGALIIAYSWGDRNFIIFNIYKLFTVAYCTSFSVRLCVLNTCTHRLEHRTIVWYFLRFCFFFCRNWMKCCSSTFFRFCFCFWPLAHNFSRFKRIVKRRTAFCFPLVENKSWEYGRKIIVFFVLFLFLVPSSLSHPRDAAIDESFYRDVIGTDNGHGNAVRCVKPLFI